MVAGARGTGARSSPSSAICVAVFGTLYPPVVADLKVRTTAASRSGGLASCSAGLASCSAGLASCSAGLASCSAGLQACLMLHVLLHRTQDLDELDRGRRDRHDPDRWKNAEHE